MEKLEVYREKLEAQLKEWKEKILRLEEKALKSTGETKDELIKSIKDLSQKKDVVMKEWEALQKESGIAWDKMSERVDRAASELKSSLDKVLSRFKH